jgi:hypothetical protein
LPIVTKAIFAREIGVGRSAVGNCIRRRQISGEALVERDGRVLIDSEIALAQLRLRLHAGQRLANGRARLDPKTGDVGKFADADATRGGTIAGGAKFSPPAKEPEPDVIFESIKAARLRQLDLANEAAALTAKLKGGGLVPADQMRTECGRIAAQVVAVFDGALPGVADQVASASGMAARDALHLLRAAFRTARGRIALSEAEAASALPELVEAAE